jgi:FtsZ-binding cell division protein ZapB
MDDGFELLEEKVRQAAETVRRLREEKQAVERERNQLQHRLEESQKAGPGKSGVSPADARRIDSLGQELKQMHQERDQIKKRIAALLEVLKGLESV